jgi:hypothetical protein
MLIWTRAAGKRCDQNEDPYETAYPVLSRERFSFRVTSFRVSWLLGQLLAGRGMVGMPFIRRQLASALWNGVLREDEGCVLLCAFAMFVLALTIVLGAVFARCWARDFGEGALSLSCGCVADVWWWAVVLVNKNPAWRSWTGRLIEVLTFNIFDMLSLNAI